MGSILSAIRDDEDEYYRLCQKYGEPSQEGCYSAHAHRLQERAHKEWVAERELENQKAEEARNRKNGRAFGVACNGKLGSFRCFSMKVAQDIKQKMVETHPTEQVAIIIFQVNPPAIFQVNPPAPPPPPRNAWERLSEPKV